MEKSNEIQKKVLWIEKIPSRHNFLEKKNFADWGECFGQQKVLVQRGEYSRGKAENIVRKVENILEEKEKNVLWKKENILGEKRRIF